MPTKKFDEKNIVLRFAAISDTHMQSPNWIPSQKLSKALEQLNAKADGKLDAVFISGDLTDYGLPEQAAELKRVFDHSS
ncbi:MAG TPA: metallophosphoesterase, partial [Ignavibacteriales bacterium]|nr:metallophosphoesterase [Ignavibacteriales bacterium]